MKHSYFGIQQLNEVHHTRLTESSDYNKGSIKVLAEKIAKAESPRLIKEQLEKLSVRPKYYEFEIRILKSMKSFGIDRVEDNTDYAAFEIYLDIDTKLYSSGVGLNLQDKFADELAKDTNLKNAFKIVTEDYPGIMLVSR